MPPSSGQKSHSSKDFKNKCSATTTNQDVTNTGRVADSNTSAKNKWGKISNSVSLIKEAKKNNTKIEHQDKEEAKFAATLAKRFFGTSADKNQSIAKNKFNELNKNNEFKVGINRLNESLRKMELETLDDPLNEWKLKENASSFKEMKEKSSPCFFEKETLDTIKEIIVLLENYFYIYNNFKFKFRSIFFFHSR